MDLDQNQASQVGSAYSGDSTQLTYLRSRFYASGTGRFLTRDTWGGDYNRPLSLNRWVYTEGNPVNRVDPSGMCWVFDDTLGDPIWYPDNNRECILPKFDFMHKGDTIFIAGNPNVVAYGGYDLWRIFLDMKSRRGQWWNSDPENCFTFNTFIGLLILNESNLFLSPDNGINSGSQQRAEIIALITSQNLYVGGTYTPYCISPSLCYSGAFNYWSRETEAAQNLINDYFTTGYVGPASVGNYYRAGQSGVHPDISLVLSESERLGATALHPSNLNSNKDEAPTGYGNYYEWMMFLRKETIPERKINGTKKETVYYYADDAIYYSQLQYRYWKYVKGVPLP